jgi:pyruvate ferredoxin oxidoreductase gamma subunit
MREIRLHGRFGQPVAKLASAIAKYAQEHGKHVQMFNAFAAVRPGGPMYAVVRTDDAPIRERSANNVKPDIVVVLDNSLFGVVDVTKGLKSGGTVMALGVDKSALGDKAGQFSFVALDSFLKSRSIGDVEAGLISSLKNHQVF